MSTLTPLNPPGYERTVSPARLAARRALAVLLGIAVLVGAGVAAYWYLMKPDVASTSTRCVTPSPGASAGASSATKPPSIAPEKVTVNVYNTTTRAGLAGRTASELRSRGFKVDKVGGDPKGSEVAGVAELRFGAKGAAKASTLNAHVGSTKSVRDKRKDGSVDLVLGATYKRLRSPEQASGVLEPATARPSGC